jgi:hypothetical protein
MSNYAKYGFKEITTDNWLAPDEIWRHFLGVTSQSWIERNLEPTLNETVPMDVRKLFEVARGALIYGYFFYPLCTLANEQLYRIMEAAVTHKCKGMGAPKSLEKFYEKVEWLITKGVIPLQEKGWWNAVRDLRNMTSHPERQMIAPPGGGLTMVVDKLRSLFRAAPNN